MNPLVVVLLVGAGLAYLFTHKKPVNTTSSAPARQNSPPVAVSPRNEVKAARVALTNQLTSQGVGALTALGRDAINKGGAAIPRSVDQVTADFTPSVQATSDQAASGGPPEVPTVDNDGVVDNGDSE